MSPFPTAHELALAAAKSYDGPWAWMSLGHTRVSWLKLEDWTVVSFRGTTKDGLDILSDIRFLPRWSRRVGFCPAGFFDSAYSVMDGMIFDLAEAARAGRLIFTGHSLGGADASIAAGEFAALGHPPAALVTFGAPRCGGFKLARLLRKNMPVWRFTNGLDPVPHVPPLWQHPTMAIHVSNPELATLNPIEHHRIMQYARSVEKFNCWMSG